MNVSLQLARPHNPETAVIAQFKYGGKKRRLGLDVTVPSARWNKGKQRLKILGSMPINEPCEDTGLFTLDDLGCTYKGACNCDPSALFDDGSCFWLEGDLNGDGYVTSNDLLAFLANFATTCGE